MFVHCAKGQAAGTNQLRPWRDYRVIMWCGESAYRDPAKIPLFFQRLREMGVNTAMVYGDANNQPLLENHFSYYVENMINRGLCLKFSSKVTDWDKFITDWAKLGRPESAFVRDYCLDDPNWRNWARGEMRQIARKNAPCEPLGYNIRDELSTTISANPFDYDFNPIALTKFREWLRGQYYDIAALNAEWETAFKSWDEVKPFSTDEIKNRMGSGDAFPRGKPDWQAVASLKFDARTAAQSPTRWNFAPWADFRTYMDISLGDALADLRDAAHTVDSRTPVGIEGMQMPSAFGGYDLWRLAQVLDWAEPYDVACSREILASFMPGKPLLTTVFEKDTEHACRRLWHLLLEGDRGCIVWWSEDCIDWKSADCALTPKARALAPALKEMTSPLAQLFLRAELVRDPIFIHYSQPSIQVDWLLESTVDGSTWVRRFSSYESGHNRQVRVRDGWLKAFQDLGLSPQFVSTTQIENGELNTGSNAALILPSSFALSDREATEISGFVNINQWKNLMHAVFADGTPGSFDQHGKLRKQPALNGYLPPATESVCRVVSSANPSAAECPGDISRYAAERLNSGNSDAKVLTDWLQQQLGSFRPEVSVPVEAHVRIHRFRAGRVRLIAFERNIDYQMSEDLKQAGGNESLENPIDIEATLAQPAYVYDLRAQKYLGQTQRVHFMLDPWQPSLFALTDEKLPAKSIIDALAKEMERQSQ
ncbi:MAG TPA: beta-galactosidase [Verrucomicrobiae bacterium]|nr:beta-galactosidase [Verrucomicrobiae bacterium]